MVYQYPMKRVTIFSDDTIEPEHSDADEIQLKTDNNITAPLSDPVDDPVELRGSAPVENNDPSSPPQIFSARECCKC